MLISIYPVTHGQHREMRAESNIASSGPFDSPNTIAGRLICVPSSGEPNELQSNEVLFERTGRGARPLCAVSGEGEVYKFHILRDDGSFEIIKAW